MLMQVDNLESSLSIQADISCDKTKTKVYFIRSQGASEGKEWTTGNTILVQCGDSRKVSTGQRGVFIVIQKEGTTGPTTFELRKGIFPNSCVWCVTQNYLWLKETDQCVENDPKLLDLRTPAECIDNRELSEKTIIIMSFNDKNMFTYKKVDKSITLPYNSVES